MDIKYSQFIGNSAKEDGGAISATAHLSTVNIHHCIMSHNIANLKGGAILFKPVQKLSIHNCSFNGNKAPLSGVMFIFNTDLSISASQLKHNQVQSGDCPVEQYLDGILYLIDFLIHFQNISLVDNIGSVVIISARNVYISQSMFLNNSHSNNCSSGGGAISLLLSEVTISGVCNMSSNHATTGGAIYATNTKVNVKGHMIIANNTASVNGGGVYFYQSELNCEPESKVTVLGNTALMKGGGIQAISSIINIYTTTLLDIFPFAYQTSNVTFTENKAKQGGGVCLEMNSKIYILKRRHPIPSDKSLLVEFVANSAKYGGAVYVADETNYQTCENYDTDFTSSECFIQQLGLFSSVEYQVTSVSTVFLEKSC